MAVPANHDSAMVKDGGIGEEFPVLEAKILLSCCFLGYYFGLQEACYIKVIFGDTIMDHFFCFRRLLSPQTFQFPILIIYLGEIVLSSQRALASLRFLSPFLWETVCMGGGFSTINCGEITLSQLSASQLSSSS